MGNKDKTKLKIPSYYNCYNSKSTADLLISYVISTMVTSIALRVTPGILEDRRTPEEKFKYLEDKLKSMSDVPKDSKQ